MSDKSSGYRDIQISYTADHVLEITLHRPEARNALNTNLLAELSRAFTDAQADPDIRCVILTGGDKVFAAGADIKELAAHDATTIRDDVRPTYWAVIREFTKPMIAAVNGYCLGGGNELAMHADVIIAGENALFGQPEINLGIIPGAGGTQRLLHAVGKSKAMEMVLGGTMIKAAEAREVGLVSTITPPETCLETARELASRIAAKSPLATMAAKKAVLQAYERPMQEALLFERELFAALFDTEDMKEGVHAFMEKRQPTFKGL
ncbi:enoyl-CoA hydratase-related protein [Aestuariispira insulae]|uniref:Enoyl-CoA hydratase n=1 Tax=Aestuariispira insulae TaxID=1461337 RepID=A0A3D9HV09_9PROT|nr:enoyl-CoA hydratase-related protein [Aestuariispira insulae]RED53354.1 enoyl-CoA hydratase [Aestuariispira insulae]